MKYDIINKIGVVLKEIQIMSYFELYQENPSLLLIILLVSFVVTIFVYGAFPLIFAKTTKKPITKKKYKRLCYGLNIIGTIFFIVFNGAASGGPYFLWTWIFSNCGVKTLNSRGLLKDNEQPNGLNNGELENNSCENVEEFTEKFQQNSDLDIDKISPQEAIEYLVAKQTGEKYIYQKIKTKVKYCSQCGSQIDPVTNKCTACGKQYFRRFKFTKHLITIIALTLIIVTTSTLNVLQYINTKELKININDLEEQINSKQSTIDQLQKEIDNIENNIKRDRVIITNTSSQTYHNGTCRESIRAKYLNEETYYIDLTTALELGFEKCPKCD